jgi:hypothetical protein
VDELQAEIEAYVRRYWVPQSVQRVRTKFPAWAEQLRGWGVTRIPRRGEPRSHQGTLAINLLNMLMRQGSLERDRAFEHHLRDLTGIRPHHRGQPRAL